MWYAIVGVGIILSTLAAVAGLSWFVLRPLWMKLERWYFEKRIKPRWPSQTGLDADDRTSLILWTGFSVFVIFWLVWGGYFLGKAVMT